MNSCAQTIDLNVLIVYKLYVKSTALICTNMKGKEETGNSKSEAMSKEINNIDEDILRHPRQEQ